jgi:hypothetical protein
VTLGGEHVNGSPLVVLLREPQAEVNSETKKERERDNEEPREYEQKKKKQSRLSNKKKKKERDTNTSFSSFTISFFLSSSLLSLSHSL